MAIRRILCLWFPRMAAQRVLRQRRDALPGPFAVMGVREQAQVLISLNAAAEAAGLRQGQPFRDAMALCAHLVTVAEHAPADQAFLAALRRWAAKFSPWVAEEPPDALVIDLTGCAHLFGGEEGVLAQVAEDCADLGLTVRAAIADTRGAAWALARYAGAAARPGRTGDAIRQEAHATRSRAAPRRAVTGVGGMADDAPPDSPPAARPIASPGVIAAPGTMRQALGPLPLAALRLPAKTVESLGHLGLRRVDDITGLPRAALARRFGAETLRRLDQAIGLDPEPVSPARAPLHFAVRISFPEPIGLASDVAAGIDRLLPALCARLKAQGRGLRRLRLEAQRVDGTTCLAEIGLARPSDEAARIRPLLLMKLDGMEAGFGFDRLRLEALETEVIHALQHRGHLEAAAEVATRAASDTALEDLISKLGTRLGQEAVVRLHPADSHIPEKTFSVLAAAWSEPAGGGWPEPRAPRPILLFRPEPLTAHDLCTPPPGFRWRRRDFALRVAVGPERLLPEWWWDDPAWRTGPRDYWRVETDTGDRLWLFFAHGAEASGGWFCQGIFA